MNENMIVESSFVSSSEKVRGFFNLSLHSKDAVFKARKLPKIHIVLEVARPYEYRNRSLAATPVYFCVFGGVSVDIFSCVLDGAFVAVFIVEVISAVRCLWQ
jgi:hypothetical protein